LTELEFEWANYHDSTAIHEICHGIVCHMLGGTVLEIAIGPPVLADRGESRTVGYCEYDKTTLSPFNSLCVAVAGEVGESLF
jgi:hypothetical protein